jgi:hypothetical protein
MDAGGLHAVDDPSSMFLANRSSGSSAVAVVLDGTRILVLEVQVCACGCVWAGGLGGGAHVSCAGVRIVCGVLPRRQFFECPQGTLHERMGVWTHVAMVLDKLPVAMLMRSVHHHHHHHHHHHRSVAGFIASCFVCCATTCARTCSLSTTMGAAFTQSGRFFCEGAYLLSSVTPVCIQHNVMLHHVQQPARATPAHVACDAVSL